jgi:hypothetical protein
LAADASLKSVEEAEELLKHDRPTHRRDSGNPLAGATGKRYGETRQLPYQLPLESNLLLVALPL